MRHLSRICLGLGLLPWLFAPPASALTTTTWAPDTATAAEIENQIRFDGPGKLDDFDRYYTGITAGRKFVRGLLVRPATGGARPDLHLVDHDQMPAYDAKNSCGYWTDYIDLDRPDRTKAMPVCDRIAISVFLSRKPYWTPDTATVAAMEMDLSLRSLGQLQPLNSLVRYYTGWTLDGHRVIQGTLLVEGATKDVAGVYIVEPDNIKLIGIADGGCSQIKVLYDADTKTVLNRDCNNIR